MVWKAPLGTAFQFGIDERYELIKGFLLSRGHSLYSEIWNDQPPFHTGVVAVTFSTFGNHILPARLVAVAFSSLLLWGFYTLVAMRSGHWAACIALVFLLASSGFLHLSVSVMLEPATIATGLMSVVGLFNHHDRKRESFVRQKFWVIVSGLLMGLALQTKLTAMVFVPAILAELARIEGGAICGSFFREKRQVSSWAISVFRARISISVWCFMVALGIALVWWFFPEETPRHLLHSHFSEGTRRTFMKGPAFQLSLLTQDCELMTSAAVGALCVVLRRQTSLLFPLHEGT